MKKILYYILLGLVIIFISLIYARFIGTKGLKTNEISLTSNNIDKSYNGLKIVQFADIHYKKVINETEIKELINEINKLKPDIVLFTGDLLDDDYDVSNSDINFLISQLSKINSTYGNYSVLGDDDLSHIDDVKNIYYQSNFTLLVNDYSIVYNENNDKLFIGGVSSYSDESADIDKVMSYINSNEEVNYKIVMIHEPDYIDNILKSYNDIDLIMAAHSINGSINIPIVKNIFLPEGAQKYYKPHYKIDNTDIYITNGIGVDDINFRLFNTPSINFYRIKVKE